MMTTTTTTTMSTASTAPAPTAIHVAGLCWSSVVNENNSWSVADGEAPPLFVFVSEGPGQVVEN